VSLAKVGTPFVVSLNLTTVSKSEHTKVTKSAILGVK
jgi:hypothetical protein